MTLLFGQILSRKVLRLEECITSSFKIDLNISIIRKTIKLEMPIRGNKTTTKGAIKTPTN